MKLIRCDDCGQVISLLPNNNAAYCACGKCCGKYLSDGITSVVNKDAILIGVDNNTFSTALTKYKAIKGIYKQRYDFFFTGWIPNIPGESITVDTVEDVINFDYDGEYDKTNYSTMPNSEGE